MSAEPKPISGSSGHSTGTLELVREHRYATANFDSLEAVCADFLGAGATVNAACLGVPGPIIDGRGARHQRPVGTLERHAVARAERSSGSPAQRSRRDRLRHGASEADRVRRAASRRKSSRARQHRGDRGGHRAGRIVAGVGEAKANIYAVASEGGHSDFAPHDAEQIELLRFLTAEFGHVSYERVLSGPGLWNIYRFFAAREPRRRARMAERADRRRRPRRRP